MKYCPGASDVVEQVLGRKCSCVAFLCGLIYDGNKRHQRLRGKMAPQQRKQPLTGEGYLILANGPARYVEMARNLAASIRVMDGTRCICLVHDEYTRPDLADAPYFDDYAILPDNPLYPGFMNKIRLFPVSPYRRSMFVDADCMLLKPDVETYWKLARTSPFLITGTRRTSGEWKGADIAQLLQQEGAPYLVQMNSGVFAFDDSPRAADFFAGLNDYYLRRRDMLGVGLHRGKPSQTDEIYLGLWMGLNGWDGGAARIDENSWMVSTWRAFWITLDPERGQAFLYKPRHSTLGLPNPLLGWDRLSPSFVHFIGMKPRDRYERIAQQFRKKLAG